MLASYIYIYAEEAESN